MKAKTSLLALSLAVAVISCAGQQKKSEPPKKEAVEEVTPQPVPQEHGKLHGLNKEQRAEFMKKEIVPLMTKVFQGFDAKHFANVTCVTCHGPGAKEGKFEMPTASLPKLDFSKKDPKLAKWYEFMSTKVVPAMATALGEKRYDPATKKGFGCLHCHMKAEKKAN